MDADERLVWYAAYGSNIAPERLRCYLEGGRPVGSERVYLGARDPSPPRAARALDAHGELWFAEQSSVWGGGVAFAGGLHLATPGEAGRVWLQASLITLGQLADLAAQESHADTRPVLDLIALGEGATQTIADAWYGRVVGLGLLDGIPVATVTGTADAPARVNPPTAPYVATIARGLAATRRADPPAIAAYLAQWPGADALPDAQLAAWIAQAE